MTTDIKLNDMTQALSNMGIKEMYHPIIIKYLNACFKSIEEGAKQQAMMAIINKSSKDELLNGIEFEIKYNVNQFHSKTRELVWDDIMQVGQNLWSACDILENQIINNFKAEFEKQF